MCGLAPGGSDRGEPTQYETPHMVAAGGVYLSVDGVIKERKLDGDGENESRVCLPSYPGQHNKAIREGAAQGAGRRR
jgi:hypothetical protein